MNPTYETIKVRLADLLISGLERCKQNEELGTLTDLYVQLDISNYTIAIYDDEEHLLSEVMFPEIEEISTEANEFKLVESLLREVAEMPDVLSKFEEFDLLKPFSLLLVDSDFENQAEIYLLEEGNLIIEDSLFKDIDKDLDAFLEKLLKE